MKNIIISAVLFAAIGSSAFAQEKSKRELKGDKYSFNYSFDKAIDAYTHTKKLTPEGQRKLAEGYHNLDQDEKAEIAYAKLINDGNGVIAEDHYNYAMVLKANGKYAEAGSAMDKFIALNPNDLRAINYSAKKPGLNNLQLDEGRYKIKTLDINSDADDFGATYYMDQIVFSSTDVTPRWIQRKYNWNRKPFVDMYVTDVKDGQLTKRGNFDKRLNGKLHDGTASFSNNGTFMAFSSNDFGDRSDDKVVELRIYFSTLVDGKWSEEEPFALNKMDCSVGQPNLTADGNTMYFTSDMPGGYGGADIYRVTRENKGPWGMPENLGSKINTEGDEMFPFYQEKNEILFFTSDGHFGLGGLDIFIATTNETGFSQIYNAGYPLNTRYDDFAAIANDSLTNGYFSSNREGGSGGDDVYGVDILKGLGIEKKIRGFAKDNNGLPVSATLITMVDEQNNTVGTLTTKDDGAFSFTAAPDQTYKITGKKKNYLDGDVMVSTFGKPIIVNADVLMLEQAPVVVKETKVEIVEGADLGKIVALNPVYFDYQEFNIRPDAETELNKIVKIMNENPGMVVKLSSYADCRANEAYNQTLSDKRAKSSADYIKKRITNPERIYGKGYGESKPVNGCECEDGVVSVCTEDAHQLNRRTEFIVVKPGSLQANQK